MQCKLWRPLQRDLAKHAAKSSTVINFSSQWYVMFAAVCRGGRQTDKPVWKVGDIGRTGLDSLAAMSQRWMLSKSFVILDNNSRPPPDVRVRLKSTFSAADHHRKSFLPLAIRLFTSSSECPAPGFISLCKQAQLHHSCITMSKLWNTTICKLRNTL